MGEFSGWHRDERDSVYRLLAERDGPNCFYCGQQIGPGGGKTQRSVDRWLPKCRGGTRALPNLRLACAKCNHDKGEMTGEEFLASLRYQHRRVSTANARAKAEGLNPRGGYWHPAVYRVSPRGELVVLGCHVCGAVTQGEGDLLANYPCVQAKSG